MNTPVIAPRRFFTVPWSIGIVLVCLALIALGLALSGAQHEQPATQVAQRPGVALALQIYRANEWRTEKPAPAWSSGLAQYRADERTELSGQPAGWVQYRAGERTPLSTLPEPQPAGWAQYRAGERTPR
jgi:hypothetical protein